MAPEAPSTGPAGELVLPYPGDWEEVALAAVSVDELWVSTSEDETDASLFRYPGDGWEAIEPEVPFCTYDLGNLLADRAFGPAAVVATDGAIWITTGEGLDRFVDDSPQFITVAAGGCVAFPGPDSGVWLRSDPGFVLATPQGSRAAVPLPSDLAAPDVCSWAAGPDGTVLVSASSKEAVSEALRLGFKGGCWRLRSSLWLWDGSSWRSIDPPDPQKMVWGVLVTDDGASWVISGDTLSRYDDHQWTTIDPAIGYALAFRAAPAGKACVLFETDSTTSSGRISCYDNAGKTGRLATTMEVFDFSVAPDGAIWGASDHLVRLAEQLPTR